MESTFASRVREYRKFKGLSQVSFAEQCGLEQGNITQMEKGTEPKQSNVAKLIGGYPDLNPDWLLLGTGPMLRDGRALTPATPAPAVAQEPEPPRLTSGVETVGHAMELMLRGQLMDQIAELKADKTDLKEQVAQLRAENLELRGLGKQSDSPDAADEPKEDEPTNPTPTTGVLPLPTLRVQTVRGLRPTACKD